MSRTVDELRNDVRTAVGRYERIESTGFTKEALAAICDALETDLDTDPMPPKSAMRSAIRAAVGRDGDDGGAFLKADLQAIAAALDA